MKNIIKEGTKVKWSGTWNTDSEKDAIVCGVYQGEYEGDKEGYPIQEVEFNKRLTCVFDLTNGHWCYGYQIHSIVD